jgi:hypothetical protein
MTVISMLEHPVRLSLSMIAEVPMIVAEPKKLNSISGIAYMFLKLHQSPLATSFPAALRNAKMFIEHSKKFISKKEQDKASFLCGNSGIFTVSAIINHTQNQVSEYNEDKKNLMAGFQICQKINYNKYGSDEILFGRAGYLSGLYWFNQNVQDKIDGSHMSQICDVIIESGVGYAKRHRLNIPMMWECYGGESQTPQTIID